MAVWQVDSEKQSLLAGSGHNYSWTNTYLIEAHTVAEAWDWAMAIVGYEVAALPEITQVRFLQVRAGVGGAVPPDPRLIGAVGLLPFAGTDLDMFQTALVEGLTFSGRLLWFKRWRGPARPEDYDGSLLTTDYRDLLFDLAGNILRRTPQVTRSGLPVDLIYVDPQVRMWQMRDGSRRRVNSVLAG